MPHPIHISNSFDSNIEQYVKDFYKNYEASRLRENTPLEQTSFAAFTIATQSFLGFAQALAKSYLSVHPESYFFIGLTDGKNADTEAITQSDPRILFIEVQDIGTPHFLSFAFQYTLIEFCTAIKPFFFKYFFEHYPHLKGLLFIDSDILIFNRLDLILNLLKKENNIVVTPHTIGPYNDTLTPNDQNLLMCGAYNMGFIALRNSKESMRFIDWWMDRLQFGCRNAIHKGFFVDQRWIDLAVCYFEGCCILKDQSCNVAYWNLHERTLSYDSHEKEWLVNGKPLLFFHFSGYDPANPHELSKHQTRHFLIKKPYDRMLCGIYQKILENENFAKYRLAEYIFRKFENGVLIPPIVRTIFLEKQLYKTFENPFSTEEGSFYDWLQAPPPNPVDLSNLCAYLHQTDVELRNNFINLHHQACDMLSAYMELSFPKYEIPEVFFERIFATV